MKIESEKETLVKIQLNSMVDYLVNQEGYSYSDALLEVLGSKTYHRLLISTMYLNQGSLYVLEDLKKELGLIKQ